MRKPKINTYGTKDSANLTGYYRHEDAFAGNFGFVSPYREYELIHLNDFDLNEYRIFIEKLKYDEHIFRFETDATRIGGLRPLVKINVSKGLVYFNVAEEDTIVWETRGKKVEWLNLVQKGD